MEVSARRRHDSVGLRQLNRLVPKPWLQVHQTALQRRRKARSNGRRTLRLREWPRADADTCPVCGFPCPLCI